MSSRVADENLEMLVMDVIQAWSSDVGARPSEVYADLRTLFWDIDDADIRHAIAGLLARNKVHVTFAGRLKVSG